MRRTLAPMTLPLALTLLLFVLLLVIRKDLSRIMPAIDDLNSALSTLSTDVQTLIAEKVATGTPDSAIQAVTASVVALDASVKAAFTPAP